MRLRNIPGADEVVSNSRFFIAEPEHNRGQWFRFFSNENPIHIEIGMGKGQFLMELARQNPSINYIGIERYTSVLLRAVQKIEEQPLPNVHFLCIDAATIPQIFEPGEVDRIYLNFSDPWPKDRHAKRRLTSSAYLARYERILAEDGRIEFKTDNQDLFTFSLEEIKASPIWKLDACTRDLHHEPDMVIGNIMTEYEEKFSSKGNPICKLIASFESYDQIDFDTPVDCNPVYGKDYPDGASTSENTDKADDCLSVFARFDGQDDTGNYIMVVKMEHFGHQSYAQSVALTLNVPFEIVEVPGDITACINGQIIELTRNNQLNEKGLTEIWIKIHADSQPALTNISNIHCNHESFIC